MSREEVFDAACEAILEYNAKEAEDVTKRGIEEGIQPMELMNKGFIPGISQVRDRFAYGTCFLLDLIQAAHALRMATELIDAAIPRSAQQKKGNIVIGWWKGIPTISGR